MKKGIIIISLISVFLWATGQNVSREEAAKVAARYMQVANAGQCEVEYVYPIDSSGIVCMYKVSFMDNSWCFVSSDKRVSPILAVGLSEEFFEDTPEAFVPLQNSYITQIFNIKLSRANNGVAEHADWSFFLDSTRAIPNSYLTSYARLDNTGRGRLQWKQSSNNDGGCSPSYNMFCPAGLIDCTCDRTPLGCGAVALGMTMWYWQWPQNFPWDTMPAIMTANTSNAEATTVSEFLYHCGMRCYTTYMCAGSSTIGPNIVSALHSFGYSTAKLYDKKDWYPTSWVGLLKSEIDNNRPVIYYGQSTDIEFWTGHFFVLDGYRYAGSVIEFHVNFGHGNSTDVWLRIDDLHEGGSDYTHANAAIIGISPTYNDENILQLPYSIIESNRWRTEFASSTISIPEPNGQLVVEERGQLYLEAGEEINLLHGFEAKEGSDVKAYINDGFDIECTSLPPFVQTGNDFTICTKNADSWEFTVKRSSTKVYQWADNVYGDCTVIWEDVSIPEGDYTGRIVLKNSYGRRLELSVSFNVTRSEEITIILDSVNTENDEITNIDMQSPANTSNSYKIPQIIIHDLYPNPTSGELTMNVDGEVQSVVILNAMGQPVGGWSLLDKSDGSITLDVSPLATGTYLLNVTTTDGNTQVGRFIRR